MNLTIYNEFECFLLPAKSRFCLPKYHPKYVLAYELWKEQTQQGLIEENNKNIADSLGSDGFYDYDELMVIFHKKNPIGVFMFRWHDFSLKPNFELNAIKKRFSDDLISQLVSQHKTKLMLMGNLAVAQDYRRSKIGFGISDILVSHALKRFLQSDADVLLTTTRNNRSTNKLCYRQGGKKFCDNEITFGVPSDIVIFYKDSPTSHPIPEINEIADFLWQSKVNGWIDMPLNFIGRNHAKEPIVS